LLEILLLLFIESAVNGVIDRLFNNCAKAKGTVIFMFYFKFLHPLILPAQKGVFYFLKGFS